METNDARVTLWCCPRCRLWVKEPMAKECALCKECKHEEVEHD